MATLDVLTSTEAAAAISDGSPESTELAAYVTACSLWLDELAGPVVVRTITDEYHDGGESSIWLRWRPITSITAVVENGSTITTAGYHAVRSAEDRDLLTGELVRRSGDYPSTWSYGYDKVKVTYVAGRFADTANVSELYKDACRLLLQNAWSSEQFGTRGWGEIDMPATSFRKFSVPNAVRDLLAGVLHADALGVQIG